MRWSFARTRSAWPSLALALLLAAGAFLVVFGASSRAAFAATCDSSSDPAVEFIIHANPCDGQPRAPFDLTVTTNNVKCDSVSYTWDGGTLPVNGTTAQVPESSPGSHSIVGSCVTATSQFTAKLGFTVDRPTISLSPTSGLAGSAFTITNKGWPATCSQVAYKFDTTTVATAAVPADGGAVNAVVPASAATGTHQVQGTCSLPGAVPVTVSSNTATYTVNTKPRPSSSVSTTVTPPTPPTSTTPASSSTSASPTPSASSTTASATPSSSGPRHQPSATPGGGVPQPDPGPTQTMSLSHPEVAPGGSVTAMGDGCRPRSPVHLSIAGTSVGEGVSDSTGRFNAPLALVPIQVGRYQVDAACGVTLTAPLDVVLVSQISSATSTLTIIVFIILVGLFIYRRRLMAPAPVRSSVPEEDIEPEEDQ